MENLLNKIVSSTIFWYTTALLLSVLTSNPAVGLAAGALIALIIGNPRAAETGKTAKKLLQLAVILLGFGMQLKVILSVGLTSIWVTMISIALTLIIGMLLSHFLEIRRDLSILLSSGTAICGGSAIAAMAPSIGASHTDTAIAMAIIFILNGLALIIFPPIGHLIGLTQEQFGFWAALAIHDTSSVVGASAIYGAQALAIGTTIKLTRALWILPISFAGAKLCKTNSKAPFQWFLVGFIAAAAVRTLFPALEAMCNNGALAGKHMMTATLFLIGGGLSRKDLKIIGHKPLLMAVFLWFIISTAALIAVVYGWMPELNI